MIAGNSLQIARVFLASPHTLLQSKKGFLR